MNETTTATKTRRYIIGIYSLGLILFECDSIEAVNRLRSEYRSKDIKSDSRIAVYTNEEWCLLNIQQIQTNRHKFIYKPFFEIHE